MAANGSLITIGFATRALVRGSREHERMRRYAATCERLVVIAYSRASEGLPAELHDGNLSVYGTNARTKLGVVWRAITLAWRVQRTTSAPWLVSVQDPFVSGFIGWCAAWRGARLHVQVHGDIFSPHRPRTLLTPLAHAFATWILRSVSCVRVVSERIKVSLVARGVDARRIVVLPIEADLAEFFAVGAARHYSDTSLTPPRLLYVGRFSPEKNLPLLLHACASLKEAGLPFSLTLLGDGSERARLASLVSALGLSGRVHLVPWSDAVPAVMAAHDVLCLSSQHEGWAMVLCEAMAAGLPVVTTDVGCAGEFVHDYEHGLIVPVGDVARYTDALRTICTEPSLRATFGRASYQAAVARFGSPHTPFEERWRAAYECYTSE